MVQVAGQLPVAPNREAIERIEGLRGSRLVTLVLPGASLDDGCIGPLYDQLKGIGHAARLDLLIWSGGGKTETPWRIVSLIREFCDHFGVLVPFQAHSAATHIAVGADEIVMGPRGELSPVDPTRTHPLLPGQRDPDTGNEGPPVPTSVQDLRHCVEFVTAELARMRHGGQEEDQGPQVDAVPWSLHVSASDIVRALFNRVHPLAIGAIEQSYRLGRLITQKMLATHLDPEADKRKIEHVVQALSDEYRSHQYPICRREVRDDLGLNVTFAESDLLAGMETLIGYYSQMLQAEYREGETSGPPIPIRNVGFIDASGQRRVRRDVLDLPPEGVPRILAACWVIPPEQRPTA